jgi:hypothetical protein
VVAGPEVFVLEKKVFKAKNGLPKLSDYTTDPGEWFWATFPRGDLEMGKALIDHRKLRRLGELVGVWDRERLAVVCGDLEAGADIGCADEF